MIKKIGAEHPTYLLRTANTSYLFSVRESGHLEHLYYGRTIGAESEDDITALSQKREFEPGNAVIYSKNHPTVALEDMCLEMSSFGHGDIREPFVELVKANGVRSCDFLYKDAVIDSENPHSDDLPSSYTEKEAEHLCVTLKDGALTLELHYYVYPDCDVITRRARLINGSDEPVEIERLMSMQLDFSDSGYAITSFHGAWAREMTKHTASIGAGRFVIESRAGVSSNRANPFFMLHDLNATENFGDVYGFNLIYSGNHYESVEISSYEKTRVVSGIQPSGFRFLLEKGERFDTPEAVFTYSPLGFTGMSLNMHKFVREHIVRGEWKNRERPVLLNSWEACYFNINEKNLVSLAKAAKELGVELFVLDDGWFGERSDDRRSLGDWDENPKKLPGGLKRLSKKITALGIGFGLWVEPEMVNVESQLYRAHPDWSMEIRGQLHSEGRNQRILDLCNPAVVDYLTEKMSETLSKGSISYVKWDMNRIFSDVYSPYLPKKRQGEVAHRYVIGLYRIMRTLCERFPHILFEGCASGGNRFDLGILSYFPQIWGSDNTDALCRTHIQEGYSYGYPQNCIGAHVAASPNHQTLRSTPLQTRYNVASFGVLGYELDVRDMTKEQKEHTKLQITLHKAWRDTMQNGTFYRVKTGNIHQWIVVSEDKTQAVGMVMQELYTPNTQFGIFKAKGLDPDRTYRFYNLSGRLNVKLFGSLVNTFSPFHIKQDSIVHSIVARFVNLSSEKEEYSAVSGSTLMNAGIKLKQSFSGTGLNDNVRVFPDFASRMYYMISEELESENKE